MRFSLKTLLVVFGIVAGTCAAALYTDRFWAAVFFTGTLFLILTSVSAPFVCAQRARAYWIGFAIFSGAYFAISMYGDVRPFVTNDGRIASWEEPRLVTSQFLLWADDRLTKFRPGRAAQISAGSAYMRAGFSPMVFVARGATGETLIIGHSIFTLLAGLMGGTLAGRMNRIGRQSEKSKA